MATSNGSLSRSLMTGMCAALSSGPAVVGQPVLVVADRRHQCRNPCTRTACNRTSRCGKKPLEVEAFEPFFGVPGKLA